VCAKILRPNFARLGKIRDRFFGPILLKEESTEFDERRRILIQQLGLPCDGVSIRGESFLYST